MADVTTRTSSGGSAIDAQRNLADMPRALAHEVNHELLQILTLLHAATLEAETLESETHDMDVVSNPSSRVISLVWMADAKVRGALQAISPYV